MPNVEPARTRLNRVLWGSGDVVKDVESVLATVPLAHPDSSVCCEMVLSADDDYFESICPGWRDGATSKKLEAWISSNVQWLKQYHGLASATLHMDEGSPHIHAMVVPIAEYEQGFRRGSKTVRKVNYNRIFGDTAQIICEARRNGNSELTKLGRLQTAYGEAMSPCGLTRGVKNSRANHRSVREHQILVNTPVITPRIPAVPVIQRTVGDSLKSSVGIDTEADKAVAAAEREIKKYRGDLNKYQRQLAAKAKEYDTMKDQNESMRDKLVDKDKSIRALTEELALTREQIGRLRQYPLHDVAKALSYELPPAGEGGKPRWKNAIDMVKEVGGFDYKQAVAWLYHEFGAEATKEIASNTAIQVAERSVDSIADGNTPRPYTRQEYAIVQELGKQLVTLDASSYRITMMHEHDSPTYNLGKGKGDGGAERLYSAKELLELVPRLNNENWRRGYNVFITPVDTARHYVLIDDLTDGSLAAMKGEAYRPNVLQRTSVASMQAVFILPRSEVDRGVGNAFFKDLNALYGDKDIRGFVHPFRAVGFRNLKDKHHDAETDRYPTVRLLECLTGVCTRALAACKAIAEATAALVAADPASGGRAGDVRTGRVRAALALPDVALDDALARRAARFYAWCGDRYSDTDWSRADWMLLQRLGNEGVPAEQIAAAIRATSPGLTARHPDVSRYIDDTVASWTGRRAP